MASPNTNWNEIASSTLKKRQRKYADNVLNHNALLRALRERGNVVMVDGGETLVRELEYAENQTYKRYSGYDLLDVTPSEVFTSAEYEWRQAAVVVSASGLELRKNSGETRTINLLQARMKNAQKTMSNNMSGDVYSSGSLTNQINGLQLLVADDPTTGTVGGINRANWSFFRNQIKNDTVNDPDTIQGLMTDLWIKCVRGADYPGRIVADSVVYSTYQASLQAIQRITTPQKGASGYSSLEFYGVGGSAPVVFDSSCPASHLYMLNLDYLFFEVHEDANFEPLPRRDSFNQDAVAVPIIFMGNLTMSNASLQGVLF